MSRYILRMAVVGTTDTSVITFVNFFFQQHCLYKWILLQRLLGYNHTRTRYHQSLFVIFISSSLLNVQL